ncbi:hypothetical protein [Herbaspirillum aquaticum]|uniref:Uncharacterized protein n=1 Tax=Herbaspirillum aquaticum TaxID=568783 RepID=A0A225SQT0_9BURK|nr:hypothetical protein [Herbaspirillum aquaticum]OWY32864.1 hypothetical protein CEJ45_19400 [Herbaspirillum aquaticum]
MPVDTNILLQAGRPTVQLDDPLNRLAQLGQLQGFQNQNALAQLQLKQVQQQDQDRTALAGAYQGAVDPVTGKVDYAKVTGNLAGAGAGAAIPGVQKSAAEASKAQREAEAAQFDLAHKRTTALLNIVGSATDQASYDLAKQNAAAMGLDVSTAPAQYDPAYVKAFGQQVLTQQQRIENLAKDRGLNIQQQQADEQARNNRANNAIAQGQLGVAQAGLGLRRQELEAGKVPAGYRRTADGNLEAIPGGPAEKDKAPTEFQGKNAVFGSRAEAADKILTDLTGDYSVGGVNLKSSSKGALGTAMNYALSPNSQKAEQAQRDFINAVLRQESGAAIAESEFDNARKQYFPQPGDSQAVIAQKAANRKLVVQGFKDNSGPLAKKSFSQSAPAATSAVPADINDLLKKYGG